jgi:hypothetical protein
MMALVIYAVLATAAAVHGWASAWQWRVWAREADAEALARKRAPTPHQRGAETARAKRLAASKAHRMALRASMETTNGG